PLWITVPAPCSATMKSVNVPPTSMPIFSPMQGSQSLALRNFQHHRHGGIAGGAAGEQAAAAATQHQLFDQLDDGARPHGRLRMAPNQRAAVIVEAFERHAGL